MEAIKDYTTATNLNPRYAEAYHNRDVVYKSIGEFYKAKKDLKRAKKLELYEKHTQCK